MSFIAEALERRVLFSQGLPAGSTLVFTGQPTDIVTGEKPQPIITVSLHNLSGQLVKRGGLTVALRIASGPNAGKLLGRAPLIRGIAIFRRVSLSAAGTYTLRATAGKLPLGFSTPIVVQPAGAPTTITWADPIVITHGGTYTGNWQSLDPNTPAVTIETSDPVVIDGANIQSKSMLIATNIAGANITITNTSGWALNPGVVGQSPGRFLEAQSFVNVDVERDTMYGTAGLELVQYAGDGSTSQTIRVLHNQASNIDGRHSTGANTFSATQSDDVQFCQLDGCIGMSGVDIGFNRVINTPGASRVEDNISIFQSSGTPASPILIHDNLIDGAYPAVPMSPNYSGGGIMVSDGHTDSAGTDTGYVNAFNNIVIGTTNYGIAVSSGHDDSVYNNIIISSGRLSDGTILPAANVGIYVWNAGNDPFFGNNREYGNTIGWMQRNTRNDQYLPDVTPSPGHPADKLLSGVITPVIEQTYLASWNGS